ncbi:RagB/SusD family nutrient uptake outer membrane protein [Flavivirga sp. 57AJ16]|uniref:RagB/SusD family nutrient uptake outer membrane protein n=1 Tax=Flavivirga sp. 57AJ16 TaxID=3025307 RepID=UPI002366CCA5|nr:RagB/SusD family nutrient uptake outer membrane protein [Flavivirga sp. 57AJ16]MDD7887728.1 RagB/SusD family nutrient uptake outer membrane protein [Flavivirga sp. 57AJ16]
MKKIIFIAFICLTFVFSSCEDYLDVVPDNVATIDNAFTDEVQAEKYLFTCYNYLPQQNNLWETPGWFTGDELWLNDNQAQNLISPVTIARNGQNANDPILNYYEGFRGGKDLFQGIRVCNIFIERIDDVRGMSNLSKRRWKAEAKFLKAYYHYYLLRMYGPIPLIDENIPVSASPEEVKSIRQPFDDCVNFIVDLLDEAVVDLPSIVPNPLEEMGRITKSIALAIKSEVLLTAASPLFNGNPDYSNFLNYDGTPFFSEYDNEKWKLAVDASLEAIQEAESAGHVLYQFSDLIPSGPSDRTLQKMTLRGRVTERWNNEVIWGNSTSDNNQGRAQANFYAGGQSRVGQWMAPTFKIVTQYYTNNGVPISEDSNWIGKNILEMRTATFDESLDIKQGETIPLVHFDRELRFYADLGFNAGTWFGQGKLDENDQHVVNAIDGPSSSKTSIQNFSITGYFPKKLVNYKNTFSDNGEYSSNRYASPYIRLAELYLNYAEALNEYQGPTAEVYDNIDKIRLRAGLEGVVESWNSYSTTPTKPSTKEGLRSIIQNERLIEFSFENHRYWDLRRWKLLLSYMNAPIRGWNVSAETENDFYSLTTLYNQKFSFRDYLWPLRTEILSINTSLVQNPGW